MKKLASILACLLLCPAVSPAQAPVVLPTVGGKDDAAAGDTAARMSNLRAKTLEIAGGLIGEDFHVRDGFLFEPSSAASSKLLAVNLVAGNRYWFCAATDENITPKLTVYDPSGKPLEADIRSAPGQAAVGVTAGATGRYFVEVQGTGEQLPEFCLLYLFQ